MLYNETSVTPIAEENGNINKAFTNEDEQNKDEKFNKINIENSFPLVEDYKGVAADKSVVLKNVLAKWNDTISDYTLNNINIHFRDGEFAAIIGPVGSGKVKINFYFVFKHVCMSRYIYHSFLHFFISC